MEMKKVILVSGGSDGLGKGTSMQLVQTHTVVILAHNKEKVEKAAEEIGCDFVCADVSNYSEVEIAVQEVIAKYGQIDYLVNNAGFWIEGTL